MLGLVNTVTIVFRLPESLQNPFFLLVIDCLKALQRFYIDKKQLPKYFQAAVAHKWHLKFVSVLHTKNIGVISEFC